MRFSFKIFLGLLLLISLAAYLLFTSFMMELKPGLRQSTEESLVDAANLLAELVTTELNSGQIAEGQLSVAVKAFHNRQLNAKIWSLNKQHANLQIYITDAQGIVRYDSTGNHVGADYSRWNDVYLTLRGEYGARSTLANPNDDGSSVMHVAAPIIFEDQIIGVLSVQKPGISVQPFFAAAQNNLLQKAGWLVAFSLLAGLLLSLWLSQSIRQLANYALAVSNGKNLAPPKVHGKELRQLANAMAAMKKELEGKQYIEHYVQTLAHQLKTPIASIQGAAELLNENMGLQQRQRFINNIDQEAQRLQQIVQYMLSLAAIENRQQLDSTEHIALHPLVEEIIQAQIAAVETKDLNIENRLADNINVNGDPFLLQQALANLLDNAIGFSPAQGTIVISAAQDRTRLTLKVSDQGPGIPHFAKDHLFERFYSLPRQNSKHKGSGLGLSFVKEIARLHGGSIQLHNNPSGGASAILILGADTI